MSNPTTEEVLAFFNEWKTRPEFQSNYDLSTVRAITLVNNLLERKRLVCICMKRVGTKNFIWYYMDTEKLKQTP